MPRHYLSPILLFLTSLATLGCQPQLIVDPPVDPVFSGGPGELSRRTPSSHYPSAGGPAVASRKYRPPWIVKNLSSRWQYIIIHHSSTREGGAQRFNLSHIRERGMDELGYHFVVGNGTDTRNGQIEVGPRWPKQKHGAHTRVAGDATNKYNNHGIGICLVGDFDTTRPSQAQINSLIYLTKGLMDYTGLPPSAVHYHKDFKPTDCPGRYFPYKQFEQAIRQ